jgi:hypothetical protein
MQNNSIKAWILTGLFATSLGLAAEKKPFIGDFPFWAGKGDQKVGQYVPGLNVVLKLTEEQIHQIHTAARETTGSDAIQTLARKIKGDSNATEADREQAHKLYQQAQTTLHERVTKILTDEQRALIRQIEQVQSEVQTALLEEFQVRLAESKGNADAASKLKEEFRARLETDFLQRLDRLLSSNQRTALEQVRTDAKAAASVKKPKP